MPILNKFSIVKRYLDIDYYLLNVKVVKTLSKVN